MLDQYSEIVNFYGLVENINSRLDVLEKLGINFLAKSYEGFKLSKKWKNTLILFLLSTI